MSLENICRAVKATLDGAGYPVSVGMRNAGTATPCIVYEINSASNYCSAKCCQCACAS